MEARLIRSRCGLIQPCCVPLYRYMNLAVPKPGETVRFHVHPDLPEIGYQRGKTAEFKGGHHITGAG